MSLHSGHEEGSCQVLAKTAQAVWMVSGCQTVEKDAFSKLSGMAQSRAGGRAKGKAQCGAEEIN